MPLSQTTQEILLTATACTVLAVIVVLMALLQEWSDIRWYSRHHFNHRSVAQDNLGSVAGNNTNIPYEMLNDVVLNHLSHPIQGWISEILVKTAAVISVVGGLLMVRGWRARLVLLRRVAWIMAIMYSIRSLTISVTTMPPSTKNCIPQVAHNVTELLGIVPKMITGELSGCTDKIFSGHTTILMISFLFWTRYAKHWAFIAYSAVHTLLGIASVMAARIHYSVDVVLAVLLSVFIHHLYYLSLQEAVQMQRSDCSYCRCPITNDSGQYTLVIETKDDSNNHQNNVVESVIPITPEDGLALRNGSDWPQTQLQVQSAESEIADCDILNNTCPVHCKYSNSTTEFAGIQQHQVDATMLLTNRRPTMFLPKIVAWMDGLWLR
ncbi:hypothetical protein COEREDRAFT_85236 [Coemansia reversa NRRL 1564]|uniref:Sphingomyelin synthase-like domain-containing protein n=1 Tax=Coemansia reversa (strain ATCC 12441 / NRRL 1564) TaxID=763665 RepID=A0A2G5BGX5_COERN|nr:hypothetical protein COEREDRAFT_85236 [Coemansia reversa NRRL 1564]|eukprot:PIA18241.1 hypothetical protein COEREDRAFT_85236 [Coemansia reversa NRRL 1564]